MKSIYHICKTPHNVRETRKALGLFNHNPDIPFFNVVYHSFSRVCRNESNKMSLAFLTANALETLNDTRGNDLGHGNNDKDDKHTNILTSCFEIGNPRENHLSSFWQEYGGPSTTTRMHKAKLNMGFMCATGVGGK